MLLVAVLTIPLIHVGTPFMLSISKTGKNVPWYASSQRLSSGFLLSRRYLAGNNVNDDRCRFLLSKQDDDPVVRFAPGGEACDGQSRGGARTSSSSQQGACGPVLVFPTFLSEQV